MTTLLGVVRRYADANGIAQTPISGLTIVRATEPSDLVYAISRPLVALVVQGGKYVSIGGGPIRQLGWPDGHGQRVARAIAVLRAEFARPLPVERLAAVAGMSPSSFYQHFDGVSSLSPLQFQKQLRLIEARRLMPSGNSIVSLCMAASVGCEPHMTFEAASERRVPR